MPRTAQRQLWSQRPDESAPAFVAFVAYRDLGPGRSADAAYAEHAGHPPGTKGAPGRWKSWSVAHGWTARAAAWDAHLRAASDKAVVKVVSGDAAAKARQDLRSARRLEHEDAAWQMGVRLLQQADLMLKASLYTRVVDTETGEVRMVPARWSKGDAIQAAKAGDQLCRLAAHMPATLAEVDAGDAGEGLYETGGELDAQLPPGALPPMPADTHRKPVIAASVAAAGDGDKPRDRSERQRPE